MTTPPSGQPLAPFRFETHSGRSFELRLDDVYDSLGLVCFELKDLDTGDVRVLEITIAEFRNHVKYGPP